MNFSIRGSSARWSHARMVRVTALDIQVSLRNPTAMLEDSMTVSEDVLLSQVGSCPRMVWYFMDYNFCNDTTIHTPLCTSHVVSAWREGSRVKWQLGSFCSVIPLSSPHPRSPRTPAKEGKNSFGLLKVIWSVGKGSEIFRENFHMFDFHLKAYYVCIVTWKLFTWHAPSICRIWS